MTQERFVDRLARAVDLAGSPACVGLDPVVERLPGVIRAGHREPARAIEAFCKGVIDAVAGQVGVVKPQAACFERFGAPGFEALERTIEHAQAAGLVVILDAKRGDIGVSAAHYAAAVTRLGADAVTANAYLGPSTVEPFLDAGLGVFVLVRTSNPDSDAVQARELAAGGTVAAMMASLVRTLGRDRLGACGLSDAGAVVGATKAADGRMLRERMPEQVFLVPGYGAQGGTADDVRTLFRAGAKTVGVCGVVVNASRSVLYPDDPDEPGEWQRAVAGAAERFGADLRRVVPPGQ